LNVQLWRLYPGESVYSELFCLHLCGHRFCAQLRERDGGGTNEMDDGHIEIPEKDVFASCSLCELLPLHHPPAQAPSKVSLWKPACTLTPQPTWA